MKETPILFTPENAQKVHEGTKTQTRRLNKLDHVNCVPDLWRVQYLRGDQLVMEQIENGEITDEYLGTCPYGQEGDRLWVREKYWIVERAKQGSENQFLVFEDEILKAEMGSHRAGVDEAAPYRRCPRFYEWGPHPSIHMPKWACRTWLELLEVRVERVREITEEDAMAEGVEALLGSMFVGYNRKGVAIGGTTARSAFMRLWESIHGPGAWYLNPWVWRLEYKKVEP